MKRFMLVAFSLLMVMSFILTACGTKTVTQVVEKIVKETVAPITVKETVVSIQKETSVVKVVETKEVAVNQTVEVAVTSTPIETEFTTVRWYIGLGTGTDPVQLAAEASVVNDFNTTVGAEKKIQLIMEVVPFASAKDTLSTEIAAGNGPDIIGPVGWGGSNAFGGQWGDIGPYMTASNYDASIFNPALVDMYITLEGQVGLPFAVFPSAIFYIPALFDEAGLEYPPAKYGEKYVLNGAEVEWSWDTLKEVAKLLTVDSAGLSSGEAGFNKDSIVQYGFTWQYENHPSYFGAFWGNGTMLAPGGAPGSYKAQAPDVWKAAWAWTYEGIWGDTPWMANAAVEGSADYANGNPFNSGKVAMTDQPLWYTCCMGSLVDNLAWEAAAMPSYNGVVNGRIDADTFRMWKGTKHPAEAFEVMAYLTGPAVTKLIIGTPELPPAYGAFPARTSDQGAWLDAKKVQFPFVDNWQVILDGLSYPDVPSAEGWLPNYNEAWNRGNTFASLLRNTAGIDLEAEIATYLADLDVIFNK